ncbi:efflux RND transporter permease subunit [Marinicrinis sediminis]|uniref:Efflux RND transporter permease subunit n=1 Tax=Marinicrinis sediminis TaxID=1652465 RepID=A0ABW5R7F0_9BACL
MQFLARFSLKNPAAILILSILLLGVGVFSFQTLKTDLLPDIEAPQLSVTVIYPGASPGDVDNKVTTVLEKEFKGLEDLDSMTSQSMESVSRIQLTYPFGHDMEQASQQVNEIFSKVSLPEDITTSVDRFSFGAIPVVSMALFPVGEGPVDEWVQNELKPELQKIEGVNSVGISAVPQQFLRLEVNKQQALQNGVGLNAIKEAIQSSYFSFPAGTVDTESIVIPVKVSEKLSTLEQIEAIRFTSPVTGGTVQLGDLATFEEVNEKSEYFRYNMKDSVSLLINKKQNANTVEVVERVFEALDTYTDKIEYVTTFDQAEGIQLSISELVEKGLFGALFASLAVLLFLRNIRATLIAIISIPLSLLIAAIFLKWLGYTLNIMSLAGMAVAVGRVVDDSIIVIENVYRKIRLQPNGNRSELTYAGTKQMISPILSSTLTSIVVFMPLGLVGGITGAFFLPFALTVVIALLASLVVAVTVIPVLSRFSFKRVKDTPEKEGRYVRGYEKTLRWSLNHKWISIGIAIVLLVVALIPVPSLGFVFLPNEKQKLISAEVNLPASTPLEASNELSIKLEERLMEQEESYPKVFAAIGTYDYMTSSAKANRLQFFVELAEDVDIDQAIPEIEGEFAEIAERIQPEAVISVMEMNTSGPPSNNTIDIDLFASDSNRLTEAASQVEQYLTERSDLKYVTNNMQEKQAQWTVELDASKVRETGVSPFQVLGLISEQTQPIQVGPYELNGENREIEITYDRELSSQEELENLQLFTQQGPIALKEIAEVKQEDVVTQIQKLDERVFARISAQIIGNDTFGVSAEVKEAVQELDLPEGVSFEAGGGSDETAQTLQDLLVAIVIAIGLVYLTMLIFFGKARLPFVILTSLLFVPIGAVVGLVLANEPLSMSAMIGFLMLVGIVVTNAIVLVDRVNQNREEGKPIREALVEAGKTRIRPILMTAFATVAALLPLAFSTPEGGLISKGLAVVVIGGLTTSTLLTLLFVPVMYEIAFYRSIRKERAAQK